MSEIDASAIGVVAARLMDDIAEQFNDEAELEAVGIVIDVSYTDEDGDACTSVLWKFGKGSDGSTLSSAHASGVARMLAQRLDTPVPDEAEDG